MVVASSDKAYGAHDELPYREDFALQPSYPYDVSKAATDMIARSYAATYDMPVAVTRLANVYGPGDVNWARVIPDTARALVRGERPVIRSDGTPERDYIYVEDAAAAYLAVADSLDDPALRGRAWNAGSGQPLSVLEVVRRLIEISGRSVEPDIQGSRRSPRRDRSPVPRLDGDPHGARLGTEMGPGQRPASGVGVVRADARLASAVDAEGALGRDLEPTGGDGAAASVAAPVAALFELRKRARQLLLGHHAGCCRRRCRCAG